MNIRIKRAHPAARLPAYATGGAACFDLPLAKYEPDTVYIGNGEYVAECVRADDGDYYLAADVDAAIEALRAEVDRQREDHDGKGEQSITTINDGGPAFPLPVEDLQCRSRLESGYGGMTLRDYFAAKAMQGLLANPNDGVQQNSICGMGWRKRTVEEVAEFAWHIADAMLRTREASNEQ